MLVVKTIIIYNINQYINQFINQFTWEMSMPESIAATCHASGSEGTTNMIRAASPLRRRQLAIAYLKEGKNIKEIEVQCGRFHISV